MSTTQHQISLQLPVEIIAKLEEEAAERRLTPEEVALAILRANCKCQTDKKGVKNGYDSKRRDGIHTNN